MSVHSLQTLSGQFVGLCDAVLVAGHARLRLVLDARLVIHELATISAIVHQLEQSVTLEAFLHESSVCHLGRAYISKCLIVNAFHSSQ